MKKKSTPQEVPISITGRHINITPALREYADKKIKRLQKYFDRLMEAHVIVSVEKLQQIAEVNISANGFKVSGTAKTPDVFASIDLVVEKLERQLKKHRDKLHERKRVASKRKMAEKDKTIPRLMEEDEEEQSSEPDIVKIENISEKPMSPDEAVMQMDIIQKPFLAFVNSSSNEINVIYRRNDGDYTLITRG